MLFAFSAIVDPSTGMTVLRRFTRRHLALRRVGARLARYRSTAVSGDP
jgi:hypothetical protein